VEELYKEFGDRIEFIGVNLGEKADIEDYVKKYGLTFPVFYDEGSKITSRFDAKIETHILINKNGVITYKERGFSEATGSLLRKLLE
jgi:peroxiredoxin